MNCSYCVNSPAKTIGIQPNFPTFPFSFNRFRYLFIFLNNTVSLSKYISSILTSNVCFHSSKWFAGILLCKRHAPHGSFLQILKYLLMHPPVIAVKPPFCSFVEFYTIIVAQSFTIALYCLKNFAFSQFYVATFSDNFLWARISPCNISCFSRSSVVVILTVWLVSTSKRHTFFECFGSVQVVCNIRFNKWCSISIYQNQ